MKLGDLVKHRRDGDIGIIIRSDEYVGIFWFHERIFAEFTREHFQFLVDNRDNMVLDSVVNLS